MVKDDLLKAQEWFMPMHKKSRKCDRGQQGQM